MLLPTHLRLALQDVHREVYARDLGPSEADALGAQLLDTLGLILRIRASSSTDPPERPLTNSRTNGTLATNHDSRI
jgi:hypothetical protein